MAITDYSTDSVVNILDSAAAVALCVFYVNYDDDRFLTVSHSLLEACAQSKTCKRIIPSEWAGDVRAFPTVPRYYKTTRIPMRETLRSQTDIEWTIVCPGFFMDYVVPVEKTYLKDYPDMLPWDRSLWEATLPGTGNEDVVVSSARDVMKATVQILKQPKWVMSSPSRLRIDLILISFRKTIHMSWANALP